MTPCEYLLAVFGSVREIIEVVGVSRQAFHQRWESGGTIPRSWMPKLLQYSEENGLDIMAEDLILGRDES